MLSLTILNKISGLFNDAILIDSDIMTNLKKQYDLVEKEERKEGLSWDNSILKLFNPHINALFSYELPDDFELKSGEYFSFLDEFFDGNKDKLKEIFRWSNIYLWLLDTLRKTMDACILVNCLQAFIIQLFQIRSLIEKILK